MAEEKEKAASTNPARDAFFRRREAVAALGLIIALIAIAVFAPLIANDRPLVYTGVNRFEHNEAVRSLRALMGRVTRDDATDAERSAFASVLSRVGRSLDGEAAVEYPAYAEAVRDAVAAGDAAALATLRGDLRRRFGRPTTPLRTETRYPVFASLNWGDVAAFVAFLVWPAVFVLRKRVGVPAATSIALLVPAVAAAVWAAAVPSRVDVTPYKNGAFANTPEAEGGPVVYDSVTWPLVPFAIDEDDLDAKFAAPPWWGRPDKTEDASARGPFDAPHWLGTDKIGRDVLTRMIWGARVSLAVGVVAVSISVVIGIVVGSCAGFFGGWVDLVLSRVIEVVITFPSFFLILTIVAFLEPSIWNIMIVLGLTGWTGIARLVRGEFLRLSGQEFVLAGRSLGYAAPRLIFLHILPNALAPVLVAASFGVAGAILTESGLSFLGFGVTVPTPSWGSLLFDGRNSLRIAPWLIYFPGFAIFVTITAYNLVGDALRDATDPRLRDRSE